MSKFLQRVLVCGAIILLPLTMCAQQLTNSNFEDWSAAAFDGNPQPKGWNASNVTQFGFKFNFAHKESGHNGGYCMMVQDQDVGAAGITETSPGYFTLGQPWVYVASLTAVSEATAGTEGGISWAHRPDSMYVYIKRTGSNVTKEDFYLLYYAWTGTAQSSSYKGKNGKCTSTSRTDEESDIRQALDANECGTATKATQIAEGMIREKKEYNSWTLMKVPIYYMSNTVPTKMNIIFSASNYPNFRANSGLYSGNSLYIDDVQLVYSPTIQKIYIDGGEWNGFNPNAADGEIQEYSLGEDATAIPSITATRGAGKLTNATGGSATFPGRQLGSDEMVIEQQGNLTNQPTVILVKAGSGSDYREKRYRIQFLKAKSSNTKLSGISYQYTDVKTGNTMVAEVAGFVPTKNTYTVELPYGTTAAPVLDIDLITKQEDNQSVAITQQASKAEGGVAKIEVTAANGTKATYTLNFTIGKLADNTLVGINIGGKALLGFNPSQTVYKVSLPTNTSSVPSIEAVSYYAAGEQTIEYVGIPTSVSALDGAQVQIKVTTPGNTTPKIYKLNFKLEASSYSYLGGLTIEGDQIYKVNPCASASDTTHIAFAADNLTYYVTLKMGTEALPTITPIKAEAEQTVETDASAGVDGTTRITVTAANGDKSIYKIVFETLKSTNSSLSDLKVGGVTIDGFDPNKTSYNYPLEIGTMTLPEITYAADEYAKVTVKEGGVNGATRITVVAGDGSTTIYVINFSVAAYTDNTLAAIFIGGEPLEGFDPETNEYTVQLPKGTKTLPEITYTKQDENLQTVNVREPSGIGDYRLTVRPQGGASRTYIIHFSVELSTVNTLEAIYLDGVALEGFDKDILEYEYTLPQGVSKIPNVTYKKSDDVKSVLSVLEKKTQIITVTAESGEQRVYKVKFIVQLSANAFLEKIYLDGTLVPGYRKDSLDYEIRLTDENIPAITVEKAAGQQVTIIAPVAAPGEAKILVAPEAGGSNTYTIKFLPKINEGVTLNNIFVDGVAVSGFEPTKLTYTATYKGIMPEVTCDKKDGQTVNIISLKDTVWLHVYAEGASETYRVNFTQLFNGTKLLKEIRANGTKLSDFAPEKRNYAYELAAGSEYPALSYVVADTTQRVLFGQIGEGEWRFIVTADNGDTAQYTVNYTIAPYEDVKLADIELEGQTLNFDENQNVYSGFLLDEGAELPDMTITRKAGQTVLVANINDTTQRILVKAEDGTEGEYTIKYVRAKSSNAKLAGILLDGALIENFSGDQLDYVDTLARGAKQIPSIFPLYGNQNQTIVTNYCYPNGMATIDVTSQDGSAHKQYTIAFPVRKSNETALKDLVILHDDVEIRFKENTLEYEVEMPYQATEVPQITWEKKEAEQRIDFISRPLGQTSEIKVTAENGVDSRTYKILFKETPAEEANYLSAIRVIFDNDEETETELKKPKTERNYDLEVPFGTRSLSFSYEKMYPEQTVFVKPGGVHHQTVITVKANRGDEADVVYTITPNMPTEDPAVLTDIKVNGTSISNFNSEKFSYIVNVTSKPVLRYTLKKGAEIDILEQTTKHWKAEVTYGNRTNTYEVWYYYPEEQVPNMDFKQWTTAKYVNAVKPTGWNTVADALDEDVYLLIHYKPDNLIYNVDNNIVDLHTQYSNPGGGDIPAFITLGSVSGSWGRFGSTSCEITGGISFHNSPDVMQIRYKLDKVNGKNGDENKHNLIQYRLAGMDGDTTLEWKNFTTADYKTYTYDLSAANEKAGAPTTLNIVLCSNYKTSGSNLGSDAEMHVDWIKFAYNSTLTGMTVDGNNATKSGNAFSYTLADAERIEKPILAFTGEVEDQGHYVTWSAPTKSGNYEVRNATIKNYAENGSDKTDYTLQVKRPLCQKNWLKDLKINGATVAGFATDKLNYTVNLAAKAQIPDVYPVPASSLQEITTSYNAATKKMTISVKPETGETQTYTVQFVNVLSNDTKLAALKVGNDLKDVDVRNHEITAGFMPDITFTKLSDLQTVSVNNGVVTVVAEDGTTSENYVITRHDTVPTKGNGQLSFLINKSNTPAADFGGGNYSVEKVRPDSVRIIRNAGGDSILFTITPEKMEWAVKGNENHTYTLNYPTNKSAESQLELVTINGQEWTDFLPNSSEDQTIYVDSAVVIEVVPANIGQVLTVSQSNLNGANPAPAHGSARFASSINSAEVKYTVSVQSEDGNHTNTYSFIVKRPTSTNDSLAAILVDGVALADFDPDVLDYVITIPSPAVKTVQPAMPSISYVAGHHAQTIEQEDGKINEATKINVTAEAAGMYNRTYSVTIESEKSHCSSLTGIMVNGVEVEDFEPGRHNYSVQVSAAHPQITWTAADRFLTATIKEGATKDTILVTAEDGVTTEMYFVNIYVKELSNNAQLSNLLLEVNGVLVPMSDFDEANNWSLNPGLAFKPSKQDYVINLPSGTTLAPSVSAVLSEAGQTLEVLKEEEQMVDTIIVTAPNGIDQFKYVLDFKTPPSKDANLSMIFLDGDSICATNSTKFIGVPFKAEDYVYQINLREGVHELPELAVQKGDANQTIGEITYDAAQSRYIIPVAAEDPSYTREYTVIVNYTRSAADTLKMIYADGAELVAFRPSEFFYNDTLPVGSAFPDLSWLEADEWQKITMDTAVMTASTLTRRIHVEAENLKKNIYILTYNIRLSDIDTLQMIYIDKREIENFDATENEKTLNISAAYAKELGGRLPEIDFIKGDSAQVVSIVQAPDTLSGNTLGYKHLITVTAPSGKTRLYTIHYMRELSNETLLNMLMLGGKPIANFDAERPAYKEIIDLEATLPGISVIKKEDAQEVEISYISHEEGSDSALVVVTAENKIDKATYVITFERKALSTNAMLKNIKVPGYAIDFEPENYDYTINIPYGVDTVPFFEPIRQEARQTITEPYSVDTINGNLLYTIQVIAPNGEDEANYTILFHFNQNGDNKLLAIYLDSTMLDGFDKNEVEYTIKHPFGSTEEDFYGLENFSYEVSDSLAVDTMFIDEDGTVHISVTAQSGDENIYLIHQIIGKDDDNALKSLTLDGKLIRGFDPDKTFYTYLLVEGAMPPTVDAETRSENATIQRGMDPQPGDTCRITCVAQDGSKRAYYIHFAISDINDGLDANENDVLIKRVGGSMQYVVASLRKDVTFVLCDQSGRLVYYKKIENAADPNDVEVSKNSNRQDVLNDLIDNGSGLIVDVIPGQIYFYSFLVKEKQIIKSGKIIAVE